MTTASPSSSARERSTSAAVNEIIFNSCGVCLYGAQLKSRANTAAVASALNQRGVPDRLASLAAQVGTAALNYAVMSWLESDSDDLDRYVVQAFEEVRDLSSPAPDRCMKPRRVPKSRGKFQLESYNNASAFL
jgi:hypothetical protein